MYYLNDQHEEYEYILYVKVEKATPYLLQVYHNWFEVMQTIKRIEKKHSKAYMGFYYIDNDFYENPYPLTQATTYYRFLRRRVNDWETFSTKEKSKIIDIQPYLKLM